LERIRKTPSKWVKFGRRALLFDDMKTGVRKTVGFGMSLTSPLYTRKQTPIT